MELKRAGLVGGDEGDVALYDVLLYRRAEMANAAAVEARASVPGDKELMG